MGLATIRDFCTMHVQGIPGDSDSKESVYNVGDPEVRSLGQEDPLEKGKAIDFSVLAQRIPRTEEPGGLQSKRQQRVRHN